MASRTSFWWVLAYLCLNFCVNFVYGDECVTYDFENDVDSLFFNDKGMCAEGDLSSWSAGSYLDIGMKSPHPNSASFISAPPYLGCGSTFDFTVTGSGTIEAKLYINFNSTFEFIIMSAMVVRPDGTDLVVGEAIVASYDVNFVNGWQTLSIDRINLSESDQGYITFLALGGPNSLILVDSFRYIPPGENKNLCPIYKDSVKTTTLPITETTMAIITEFATELTTETTAIPSIVTTADTTTDSVREPTTGTTETRNTDTTPATITESVTDPTTETTAATITESVTEPTTETTAAIITESITEPTTETTVATNTESVTEPTTETTEAPNNDTTPATITEFVTEPTTETTAAIITESITEPTSETTVATITESVTDPTTETTAATITESVVIEPTTATTTSTITESATEPTTGTTEARNTDITPATITESVTDPTTETTAATLTESFTEPITKTTVAIITESVTEPTTETTVATITESVTELTTETLDTTTEQDDIEKCVTYNFESDYDVLFSIDNLCNGLLPWQLENYTHISIESPHPASTAFITPNEVISCISSIVFKMEPGGTIEAKVFMEPAQNLDFIIIQAYKVTGSNFDTTAGFKMYTQDNDEFVSGWNMIRFTILDITTFDGYIIFMGSADKNSTVLVDSVRYIPPLTPPEHASCNLY